MSFPNLVGMSGALTNVQEEHLYSVRCVFGAGTAMTFRSAEATPTRPSATTLKIQLPQAYVEITNFNAQRKAAVSVAGLEWIITTDNIAVDGSVTLTSVASNGTATAPATGDAVYVKIGVSQNQLNDRFIG